MACLRNASISAIAYAQDTALYRWESNKFWLPFHPNQSHLYLPPSTNVTLYNKFRPVVDGKLIYDFPTKLLTEGRFAHVPTIAG